VLVGECLQIIIRFFRHEVAKKRQGNRGNVENNVKILAIAVLLLVTLELAQAEPREKHERNKNYIIRRQQAGSVTGGPTIRRLRGSREIDIYRNGMMFEKDNLRLGYVQYAAP
jgi:hypothetical protein